MNDRAGSFSRSRSALSAHPTRDKACPVPQNSLIIPAAAAQPHPTVEVRAVPCWRRSFAWLGERATGKRDAAALPPTGDPGLRPPPLETRRYPDQVESMEAFQGGVGPVVCGDR